MKVMITMKTKLIFAIFMSFLGQTICSESTDQKSVVEVSFEGRQTSASYYTPYGWIIAWNVGLFVVISVKVFVAWLFFTFGIPLVTLFKRMETGFDRQDDSCCGREAQGHFKLRETFLDKAFETLGVDDDRCKNQMICIVDIRAKKNTLLDMAIKTIG